MPYLRVMVALRPHSKKRHITLSRYIYFRFVQLLHQLATNYIKSKYCFESIDSLRSNQILSIVEMSLRFKQIYLLHAMWHFFECMLLAPLSLKGHSPCSLITPNGGSLVPCQEYYMMSILIPSHVSGRGYKIVPFVHVSVCQSTLSWSKYATQHHPGIMLLASKVGCMWKRKLTMGKTREGTSKLRCFHCFSRRILNFSFTLIWPIPVTKGT